MEEKIEIFDKAENQSSEGEVSNITFNDQTPVSYKNISRTIKGIILVITLTVISFIIYILAVSSGDTTGKYEGYGYFMIMLLPLILVIYPGYLIYLGLKYGREKSNMDLLDKVTFWIILFCYISLLIAGIL